MTGDREVRHYSKRFHVGHRDTVEALARTLTRREDPCICRVDDEGRTWHDMGCHQHGGISNVSAGWLTGVPL